MEIVPFHSYCFWPEVDPLFPTSAAIPQGRAMSIAEGDTGFGFVCSDTAWTENPGFRQQLHAGMFFSVPGPATVTGLYGFVCTRKAYRGLPIWGGPIETLGRLKYIDGCSDTLVLAPPKQGDPCLNYLYIPAGVRQTAHTHPSVRVGCIIDGAGTCRLADKTIDLVPGAIFVLPTDERHSFHTSDRSLRVMVYHPDSDFGPTDEDHPMINRTIIGKKTMIADNKSCTPSSSEFIE